MNTFTNFDAARTSAIVFRGFTANSVGRSAANLAWGQRGTSGVYVPTISGVAVDDVSSIRGYTNKQTISNSSVLVSFDKHKGFHFTIDEEEQATTVVDLGAAYLEQEGRLLAAQVDTDLFSEATSSASQLETVATTFAKANVMNAFEKMNNKNVPLTDRVWVCNPALYSDILAIDDFVGADKTGRSQSDLNTGQKGELLGSPVLMSQNLGSTEGLYIYRPALALALNIDMQMQVGRVPGNFGTSYEGSIKYGVKGIDGDGIVQLQIT